MKKILITGFSGFVASHFLDLLYNEYPDYEVYGIDIIEPRYDYTHLKERLLIHFDKVNLLDIEQLNAIFQKVKPDYVLHLAAFSSVAFSWKNPEVSFTNNSNIFLNLIDAVKNNTPNCRILSVGSSEEYGNVSHENLPIRENQPVDPLSPYAVARVAQEMMSKVYANAYGINIVLTRSFNHIGPRQDNRFVIPSFIERIKKIKESGKDSGTIETGNLEIIRDFVDVRDVVKAYYLLLTGGMPGEIYNVCSGQGIRLKDVVEIIANEIGVEVETIVNPEYIRPNDNMEIVGSHYKIETELGWKPKIPLRTTLRDMI